MLTHALTPAHLLRLLGASSLLVAIALVGLAGLQAAAGRAEERFRREREGDAPALAGRRRSERRPR